MKFITLVAVCSAMVGAASGACTNTCTGGNCYYYCEPTNKFIYKNVGFSGSYRQVSFMGASAGDVSYTTVSFSGPLSPFDGELSMHFRGPINLKEFGVYYPNSGANKKRNDVSEEDYAEKRHVHHKHIKRAVEYTTRSLYVDQNGEPIKQSLAPTPSPFGNNGGSSPSPGPAAAGDWKRTSHFVPGKTTNVTVLNNFGGSGSGVWSAAWGNSLSYANRDNTGAASGPVPLDDVTVKSNSEFSLWSGVACGDKSETGSCPYSRPGTVAMHGFGGTKKIFVFSYTMPPDTQAASQFNADKPAIWGLYTGISLVGQYLGVSCWDSGCGEADLFEVLDADKNKMVTALHYKQGGAGGGSGDYIPRPTSSIMKAVAIFHEREIHIKVLDSSFVFGNSLSSSQVSQWIADPGSVIQMPS